MEKRARKINIALAVFTAAFFAWLLLVFLAYPIGQAIAGYSLRVIHFGTMDAAKYAQLETSVADSFRTGGLALALTGGFGCSLFWYAKCTKAG